MDLSARENIDSASMRIKPVLKNFMFTAGKYARSGRCKGMSDEKLENILMLIAGAALAVGIVLLFWECCKYENSVGARAAFLTETL